MHYLLLFLTCLILERAHVGYLVIDLETQEIIAEKNADHYFIPASLTKIFTSYQAIKSLGPDWQTRTSLYGAPPINGLLPSDLILYGRGDPTFDHAALLRLTDPCRSQRLGQSTVIPRPGKDKDLAAAVPSDLQGDVRRGAETEQSHPLAGPGARQT